MKRGLVGREGERFQESEYEEEDREREDDIDREKRRKSEAEEGDGRISSQPILGLKMDQKKSPNRTKRHAKVLEDNFWDCSVCTYRNTAEAFKCLMCDVRKGTSTRKPRINPQLVAQQVAQQYTPTPLKPSKKEKEKLEKKGSSSDSKSLKKSRHPPRLKNVDRSSAQHREVTVNNVTVIITEFKPKLRKAASDQSGQSSSASSENGSQSESSVDARSGDLGTDSRSS
ncbi:YY1-associated factor 2 isoform X2 [Ischnura elegans]|uniref:YY1-associated factor 2 isoform X2 n=1 Tax=Ischnura elegans TaxID=197161 RepID=UPI001ED88305|nr:YY1-associated factor 2 isoform X2 [Ischnura elegans]